MSREKYFVKLVCTMKNLISRNFWWSHDESQILTAVWKSNQKYDYCFYGKINTFFVKSTVLLKKFVKSWFHRNFWAWSRFIVLFHKCDSATFTEIPWNQLRTCILCNYTVCCFHEIFSNESKIPWFQVVCICIWIVWKSKDSALSL